MRYSDFEITWYDYGARWYDPAVGRWGHVDPLTSDFPWNSPYSFTANMPIAGIDPDGRYIIILAAEGKGGGLLKSQLEAFFNGNVSVSYTEGAEARLKLTRTGELTERQKYLFNTLNQMAEDDGRGIKIRISTDDPWVPFETYDSRQIDPADFEELPETGSTRTQGGWYAHFFTEQWYRQVELGVMEALEFKEGQSNGFIKSHTDALYHEYRTTGVVTTDVSEETLEDGSRLIRFASFDKEKNFVGGFNILENNMGEISRQMNNTPIKIQELKPLQREAVESIYERIGNDEKN